MCRYSGVWVEWTVQCSSHGTISETGITQQGVAYIHSCGAIATMSVQGKVWQRGRETIHSSVSIK